MLDSRLDDIKINVYLKILASRSSIWRDKKWYYQEEENNMEFLCGTQISHALAYVLSIEDQDLESSISIEEIKIRL